MKKITVTIGIPAYNEEANVSNLLNDVLNQKLSKTILKEIIVFSDGSTDQTVNKVKEIRNSKVSLIEGSKRQGRAKAQNTIMKKAYSDILILIDADIQIPDKRFIEKIIKPIVLGADLTSVTVQELDGNSIISKILATSMKFKKYIFENYNEGNNLYTCHGRARAFSKRLYKNITFKQSVGEDAYSYFYAIANGYKYRFAKNTEIYYRLPENFADHEKQSVRFYKTLGLLESDFGKEMVKKENFVTSVILIRNLLKYFFISPLIIIYFALAIYLKLKSYFIRDISNAWSISKSSKKLINN